MDAFRNENCAIHDGNVCRYKVKLFSVYNNVPQGMTGSPVMLTASRTTRLLLNVTRDEKGTSHTIYGWLKWNDTALNSREIQLKLNVTEYVLMADNNGYFSKTLDLQPKDNNVHDNSLIQRHATSERQPESVYS